MILPLTLLSEFYLDKFYADQLATWPEAADNYQSISDVERREFKLGDFRVVAQHNPRRIRSSVAKTDARSIASRRCFLCKENRPAKQGYCSVKDMEILVNPYPILPRHFTIASKKHTPQRIADKIALMAEFARQLPDTALFYNGPRCGASAPDHLHFQAVRAADLPICQALSEGIKLPFGHIIIDARSDDWQLKFHGVLARLPKDGADAEPRANVYCMTIRNALKIIIIPRRNHRPDFYGDAPGQMLISPASIEMGGIMVAARKEDFDRLNAECIAEIYRQVTYTQAEIDAMMREPLRVSVGIVTAAEIKVNFLAGFSAEGERVFKSAEVSEPLIFKGGSDSKFAISGVTIGIGFHWERQEEQQFGGSLRIVPDGNGNIVAINDIDVEDYLLSVISSEMSATSSLTLLKVHAIISRSWLLDKIFFKAVPKPSAAEQYPAEEGVYIKWYGDDAHSLFDVCADDHCQRYQGVTRQTSPLVAQAVEETRGCVLTYADTLCDARFSKCCGGVMETYDTCWDDKRVPYLESLTDDAAERYTDLSAEADAARRILGRPDAFCAAPKPEVLRQVLNNYDLETPDFYRWHVDYTTDELSEIVREKSGIDFGRILDVIPIERGKSGRIKLLEVRGEKCSMRVGKELEIRRWLSKSHLYSSAFVVEKTADGFRLTGAGWGHGAGLCQIGAAVMASEGYIPEQILKHYYPGTNIRQLPATAK